MSKRRLPKDRGFVVERLLERGPNGRALCRQCSQEVPAGRRTFCSKECVHAWSILRDVGYQKRQVEKRDHGVCCLCGKDCLALAERINELRLLAYGYRYVKNPVTGWSENVPIPDEELASIKEELQRLLTENRATGKYRRVFWDMDHIIPVVEGGGECGLDNLRTLCIPCHKGETKKLAAKRAAERKTSYMSNEQNSAQGWAIIDGVHRVSFRSEVHVLECWWAEDTEEWLYAIDRSSPIRSHHKRPRGDFKGARQEALELFGSLRDSMIEAYRHFERLTALSEAKVYVGQ